MADRIDKMDPNISFFEASELLCRLICVPRVSRQETEAADLLQAYMSDVCRLDVRRSGNNLWTVAPGYDAARPTLLLCAHIDTVRPTSGWTRNPHEALREGGRIYGLGSNDDGASLVCLLQTFRRLSQRSQPYNLVFLASAEEEVSGAGGVGSGLPQLPPISVALVGEPTGMQPAIAEKGLMVLDVTCHGRSGHAARDEGDNAIYHAMDAIQWFRTHQWPRVSPMLGAVKMSVTIVNAGTQHNVVPDRCTFTVDVRSNELYSNTELLEAIRPHVRGDVVARSTRLNSSAINAGHPLVRRAVALGRTPFGSPTLSDQALMPFPTLKMGPGQSSRSHTADEYVEEQELRDAIPLYLSLLDGLEI